MDVLQARHKRQFGERQEQAVADYLGNRGLELVAQNYQCKMGEIDLIMRDQETLVFIEVRFRRSQRFGTAVESVNLRKQNKIIRCARYFLLAHKLSEKIPCRFDVIGLFPRTKQTYSSVVLAGDLQIEWVKGAFGA